MGMASHGLGSCVNIFILRLAEARSSSEPQELVLGKIINKVETVSAFRPITPHLHLKHPRSLNPTHSYQEEKDQLDDIRLSIPSLLG